MWPAKLSARRPQVKRVPDLAKARDGAHFDLALPWYSVQTNLEIARADLAQLTTQGARVWLAAADEILRRRPQLGDLAAQSSALHAEADRIAALSEGRAGRPDD